MKRNGKGSSMIDIAEIPQLSGLSSEHVLKVASLMAGYWEAEMARNTEMVQTLDFVESVTLIAAISSLGKQSPTVMELGTQLGISACIIYDGLKLLGLTPRVVTYDIRKLNHLFKEGEVEFRLGDITGRCAQELDSLKPDAVFLDAHPWDLTLEMLIECMNRRIMVTTHDVSDSLWEHNLRGGKLPIEGNQRNPNIPWERKVLEKVFGEGIHSGFAETPDYTARLVRSRLGLAICMPKSL
jgi:hypothetical protein